MKLSKISWLILALGIFVITFASLGAARSQRLSEGRQLSEELAVAKQRLRKLDLSELTARQESLRGQINRAAQEIEAARFMLSQPNDSITISEAVFRLARDSGVEVVQIGASGLTGGTLNKMGNLALPLTVSVRGDVPSLIAFVIRLNSDLPTGVVRSVQIVVRGAPVAPADNVSLTYDPTGNLNGTVTANVTGAVTGAGELPTAVIQMEVYTYKGG